MKTNQSLPARLDALRQGCRAEEALSFYDACPALRPEEMLGFWWGEGLHTNHPLDGLLETCGWHGKSFLSLEEAHPLWFEDEHGYFTVNPALVPVPVMRRSARFASLPGIRNLVKWITARGLLRLVRTRKASARLRSIEYRGVATATMSYDALPINDHFRRVDERTVLGLMDARGLEPFFFVLHLED